MSMEGPARLGGGQKTGPTSQSSAGRLAARAQHGLQLVLGWVLLFAVLVNLANVIARYFLDRAILGAEEIQVFAMVWITFVGAAVVACRDEHLRMDVLLERTPLRLRRVVTGLEALLLATVALFMLVQSARFTWQMVEFGRNSDALGVPMVIPHSGVVLGFALLSCLATLRLLRILPAASTRHKDA